MIPIIRTPTPIPTIKIILGCFPLLEELSSLEDVGLYEGAPAGDAARHGVVIQRCHNQDRKCCTGKKKLSLCSFVNKLLLPALMLPYPTIPI